MTAGPFRGHLRVPEEDLPPGFLRDPRAVLHGPDVNVLRSKKNRVVEIPREGGQPGWYARHYRPRGLHPTFRNSVMISKEANAFFFALEYEKRNVPTAEVMAFLERRENGIFRESVLLTRAIPSRSLKEWIKDSDAADAGTRDPHVRRRAWLRAFMRFVRSAHAAGVYHGDLNTGNVLVPDHFDRPSPDAFVLIDVNRTRFGAPHDPTLVSADLSRIGWSPDERRFLLRCYAHDGREYVRLRRQVLRRSFLHESRRRLNRRLGIKKALAALKLK